MRNTYCIVCVRSIARSLYDQPSLQYLLLLANRLSKSMSRYCRYYPDLYLEHTSGISNSFDVQWSRNCPFLAQDSSLQILHACYPTTLPSTSWLSTLLPPPYVHVSFYLIEIFRLCTWYWCALIKSYSPL